MTDPSEPTDPTTSLDPDNPLGKRSEDVRSLGENRYLISLESDEDRSEVPVSSDPSEPLGDAAYGFELTVKGEGGLVRESAASNDVREAFDALIRAYARAIAPDHPPEEVVRTLLSARVDSHVGGRDGLAPDR